MAKPTQRELDLGYCEEAQTYCSVAEERYQQGKADMLDSIILAVKDNYYCLEDLCGESIDCSDCMVKYLELLKEQK